MTDLNLTGESYAHSLVAAGKVDKPSAWSFDAPDGNALLGENGDDWENYSRHHLGLDRAANDKTKARYTYPFAKADRVYGSGLVAIRQRAAAQGDGSIERAAGSLIDLIDKPKSSTGRAAFEYKFVDEQASPGTFEGYRSVFNNEDDGGDLIQPGAFAGVIRRHQAKATMPKMLLGAGCRLRSAVTATVSPSRTGWRNPIPAMPAGSAICRYLMPGSQPC
jgi:hypothetical protein